MQDKAVTDTLGLYGFLAFIFSLLGLSIGWLEGRHWIYEALILTGGIGICLYRWGRMEDKKDFAWDVAQIIMLVLLFINIILP